MAYSPEKNIVAGYVRGTEKTGSAKEPQNRKKMYLSVGLVVMAGILSGFLLSRIMTTGSNAAGSGGIGSSLGGLSGGGKKSAGVSDTKSFPDNAEGTLKVGGLNGEGTHQLERPGGESQTVYLTSSVLDLNEFVGKKIKVWGETHAAKQAGWLMDVGKVELLE